MKKKDKKEKKVLENEELDIIEDTTDIKEEIIKEKKKSEKKKEIKKEKKEDKIEENKEVKEEKEIKQNKKVDNFLLLEKDHHGIKVFLSILVILVLLALVGFLYYKKVYSSPLVTFTSSLSNYQKELTKDYKVNTYNKISAILELDLKTDDPNKTNGVKILNDILTNIVFASDKDNTYLEVNTKYNKEVFANLKLYSKEENNKMYSYIKLDKYDQYLKYENKYLQHFSLIRLLHEENLNSFFKNVLESALSKNDFTREEETINNVKLTKNTMKVSSSELEKLVNLIIEKLKKDSSLLDKINSHYNNAIERLENYVNEIKKDPKDIEISTYNKKNLKQDLVMLEYKYGDKKITFEPVDNVININIENKDTETDIKITKNNKASYTIDFDYKKDNTNYKFNLIVTLDKTNDVPKVIIGDEMDIKVLNNDTLPSIISEVTDNSIKDILRIFQK